MRLRRTRSSASGSPRTVVSSSALSVIVACGARAWACSRSGRAIEARSIGVRVGCASRRASPRRSLTRRPSRSLSRATAASRRSRSGRSGCSRRSVSTLAWRAAIGVRSSWEASARKRRVAASLARASSIAVFEGVEHLVEGGGEAAELGVGAAGLEAELGVAVGDACRRLDDGGEGAQGGAGALEDEEGGERERGGGDQELDEEQVGDGVVDARAAGAEGESRSVGEDLVEDQQRSVRLDRRRRSWPARSRELPCRRGRRRRGTADGDPLEREARHEWLQRRGRSPRARRLSRRWSAGCGGRRRVWRGRRG